MLEGHVQLKESNRLMDTPKTCRYTEYYTSINTGEQNNQGRSEVQETAPPARKTKNELDSKKSNPKRRGLIGQYHTAQIRSGRPQSADNRKSVTGIT